MLKEHYTKDTWAVVETAQGDIYYFKKEGGYINLYSLKEELKVSFKKDKFFNIIKEFNNNKFLKDKILKGVYHGKYYLFDRMGNIRPNPERYITHSLTSIKEVKEYIDCLSWDLWTFKDEQKGYNVYVNIHGLVQTTDNIYGIILYNNEVLFCTLFKDMYIEKENYYTLVDLSDKSISEYNKYRSEKIIDLYIHE